MKPENILLTRPFSEFQAGCTQTADMGGACHLADFGAAAPLGHNGIALLTFAGIS